MTNIHPIPLDHIDDHALIRDRSVLRADRLEELTASLRAHGLRLPVEVIPHPRAGDGRPPYALLSGLRRITAWRALAEDGGAATIPALVRPAMAPAEALAAVIEENEIREPLSAWEQGRVVFVAVEERMFETVEEAAETLFPAANKIKLSRIRAIARAVEAMTPYVYEPERWSLRQCLRLASAVRAGFADVMRAALEEDLEAPAEAQWRLILPYLEEAEALPEDAKPVGTRPRRLLRPRRGVVLRREKTPHGWALHMHGRDATDMLTDRAFDEIERLLAPLAE